MITAKILNPTATLNEFKYLETVEFIAGSDVDFVFRLYDTDLRERHTPPSTAIITVFFNKVDDTELSKVATVLDTLDRSMWKIALSEADTAEMLGGNVRLEIDVLGDGTKVRKSAILSALSRIVLE